MAAALRTVGSIVVGLLVAFILVVAVEVFSAIVHPFPPDIEQSMEEMCKHVERYPDWVLAVVVPMYAAIALASTWIAGRLGNRGSAILVGLLVLVAAGFNVSQLPYPAWFKIACLVAIPCSVALGIYGSRRRVAAGANSTA